MDEIKKEELLTQEEAAQIVEGIRSFGENLRSADEAAKNGVSKERWLAGKLEEVGTGMTVVEYGERLQAIDRMMGEQNEALKNALEKDGAAKMSPNLDGNIAEEMIARTTKLSGLIQGKDIQVEVRGVTAKNSVSGKTPGSWRFRTRR